MGTRLPREVFWGLVISEQIAAAGCAPVAPVHPLTGASPGGQGRCAAGAGTRSLRGEL